MSHCEGLLLNKKTLVTQTCFSLLSLFYFLVFFLPADHLCFLFFNTGFSSWALIPRCLCCCLPLFLWNFFFFFKSLTSLSLLFSCFSLTCCKGQSKLCSSKLLLLHCTDPSSSMLSCAYVTHYNKCLATAERLHSLFATAHACFFTWATSVTHLTPLLAILRINQKTILF